MKKTPHLESNKKKTRKPFIKLAMSVLWILILGTMISCECTKVECSNVDESFVELNFVSNDEDIIFGDSPKIQIEELIIKSETESNIPYSTFENQIGVWLEHNVVYEILVGELDTIQISGNLQLIGNRECCDIFEFESFKRDGVEICSSNCKELNFLLD